MRQSLALAPNSRRHSKLLASLQYGEGVTAEELLPEHRAWNDLYASDLANTSARATRRVNGQPLRLGFVSHDFGLHPIGFLALRALECLDRKQCGIVCYSDRIAEDAYTARFRAAADLWRPIYGVPDKQVAEQIREDRIDILVDLMGHTANRLLVFARRPAPLQVTWLGYVGTTGLSAMDCLLADRFHVPEGEERHYTEKVLRMSHGYACYGPPGDAPEVGPLPSMGQGSVTFGCFNNPMKYSPPLLDVWARILQRVPSSRLLIKFVGLDDPYVQARLTGEFVQRGVAAERVLLEGKSPHRELLTAYNCVDLALDTQPYSGGLTTCEALWMGVPVITFPGRTFAGRHAVSHLTNAGYQQFIAHDAVGYIELAVQWASRLDELAALRSQLRDRMRSSPLCDAPRFAADFLRILQVAWQEGAAIHQE
jgi:protein O-GlcNAc transferase